MSTKGLIGEVHSKFSADTTGYRASMKGVAESLKDVESCAGKTTEAMRETGAQIETVARAQENAARRYKAAFDREQEAQKVAAGRASQMAAAAQEVARAEELAALKADILARANEQLGLSTVPVIRSFQVMGREVREQMGAAGEKIVEVAERAELSADGIASAFGGLGAALGGGLLVAFAAHALDNLAELNVELGDLHEKTGMAVQDLAGLRLVAQSKGLDFTTISMGLTRLGKAMYEAKQGMQEDREAFSSLGISMKEVETDSVEQMFYRVSKAIGENRNLVLSDGTALELFGRGGKELIPILQQYGSSLEGVVKQQASMTQITDESVAASQKWLRATSDLSAEFHGAFVPVLEGLADLLPYVNTGFHLLEAGVEMTLGTVVNYGLSALEILKGVGLTLNDISSHNFADIPQVWSGVNRFGTKLHETQDSYTNKAEQSAWKAWGSRNEGDMRDLPGWSVNKDSFADGALLKDAKQQLADMERKHALTKPQIIKFWQQQLAKAKPGSVDYDEVNVVLGNLMQHAGASAASAAGKQAIQAMKDQHTAMQAVRGASLQDDLTFWETRVAVNRKGSEQYLFALREMNEAIAKLQTQSARGSKSLGVGGASEADHAAYSDLYRSVFGSSANQQNSSYLTAQARATEEWVVAQKQLGDAMESNQMKMAEAAIRISTMSGAMTKLDGATAIAALHQREYSDTMQKFQEQIAWIQSQPWMTGVQKKAAVAEVQKQVVNYQTDAAQVAQQDAMATGQWQPGSTMVAVRNALDEFVMAVRDTSGQIHDLIGSALEGTNQTLSRAIMAHAYTGQEYRRNIVNALGGDVRGLGAKGLDFAMGHAEGGLLSKFGFGPKAKRGESAANPLFVSVVGAGGGIPAAASAIPGLVGSLAGKAMAGTGGGAGGVLKGILAGFQGFFANGGSVMPGMAALVGEAGPELFVPSTHGTIVPNHMLAGGAAVEHHHHYNIDARGSHDPSATEAAVHRGLAAALSMTPQIALNAAADYRRRTPTSKQRA
jgi:hypothetical protein